MTFNEHRTRYVQSLEKTQFSISGTTVDGEEWATKTVDKLLEIKKNGKNLFFIGNGASNAMSSHFATDFTKNGRLPSEALSDGALLTCFGNDYSFQDSFAKMLEVKMKPGDGLVAISSSGKSPNILQAANYVKQSVTKGTVFTFSGFNPENPLRALGDHGVYVPETDYGFVESAHSYFLHIMIDFLCHKNS